MKIKKAVVVLSAIFLLLPNMAVISFAAENAGIAVRVFPETVKAGEEVTVTVSLTDYNMDAVPIRGIQIDVTDVDESILTVVDNGYVSLIEDNAVAANTAVYQQKNHLLRLIYAKIEGTLQQPYEDVFQMKFMINPELTEAGSITLPLTVLMVTTEENLTINDEITIAYVPSGEDPDPDIVNVDIEWGGMNYTYSDGIWNAATHSYDNSGWSDDGSGYIKVVNSGTVDTTAAFAFVPDREEISGSFTDGTNVITDPVDIPAGQSQMAYLLLSGKPAEELDNAKIGTVTVRIGGE